MTRRITVPQRSKEEAHDYRYFPEPDLPPLVIEAAWIEQIRRSLPELPAAKILRFRQQYGLSAYDANVLAVEPAVADYFEQTTASAPDITPKTVANWVTGEMFSLLNQAGIGIEAAPVSPLALAGLLRLVALGQLNQNTAKAVLNEMFRTGKSAPEIVSERGLSQISDSGFISDLVQRVLEENPAQVASYLGGKEAVSRWLFGQVCAGPGSANPQVLAGAREAARGVTKCRSWNVSANECNRDASQRSRSPGAGREDR
jgi:aspartyl-tRNA(Asn)/glutamyl-tRNA(Gln) amidotransferase subunit B